ncbi:hypothetical protein D779_0235 [Imhoffiella purpurea]|uniref:Uncharacterized protein n=1 Tax=Imhoffiella purpurea TaxID=1249627 RepID=W9UVF3_9GAMM|nr:hypothetical protein D779_0235 [Imhoffiella purpurea]
MSCRLPAASPQLRRADGGRAARCHMARHATPCTGTAPIPALSPPATDTAPHTAS